MSYRNVYLMLVGASLTLSSCTKGQKAVQVETPAKKTETRQQQQQGAASGDSGAVGITLSKQALQQYAINLDNLNYKFTYLTSTQAEKISFDAAGKAQLKFNNLPSDQAGTVTLEVLDGTTLKLRGSVDNVTLKSGQNTTVALTLKEIAPNGGGNGTTDLTIDVTLDNNTGGTGGTGGATGSTGATGTTGGTGGTGTTPPTGGGGGGGADPIATWDGKSNQGNSKWKIEAVTNSVGSAAPAP